MDSDDGRLWLATLPALAAGASGVLVGREAAAEFPSADWRVMFYGTLGVTQVVMYVVYLWLTLRRFHGLDARTLERDLRTRRAMRSHVMVAFGFNSMLVASLATLLLSRG